MKINCFYILPTNQYHGEHGKSALYGLYNLLEKFSIVLGTMAFRILNQWTGSMRLSKLMLLVFFFAGGVFFSYRRR